MSDIERNFKRLEKRIQRIEKVLKLPPAELPKNIPDLPDKFSEECTLEHTEDFELVESVKEKWFFLSRLIENLPAKLGGAFVLFSLGWLSVYALDRKSVV